jgi:enediyne biosynthesis protein E4
MSGHMKHLVRTCVCLAAICLVGCAAEIVPDAPAIQFTDISSTVGIDFTHVSGTLEQRLIIESMSGGAAFFDYDDDSYLDVFVVDATRLEAPPPTATNRLYRNTTNPAGNDRRFQDVTDASGLRRTGWGMGCTTGDIDGDGHVDLYVTYFGANVLYRNEDGSHFSDITEAAGVGDPRWGTSAAFGDLDADGDLDLYVANYLVFDLQDPPNGGEFCSGWKGLDTFCGPHGLKAQADVLYRNDGDGRFTDISVETGVDEFRYPALGVLLSDTDRDGDQDLYVANDSRPNLLFRNDGDWQLTDIGPGAGVAMSEDGRSQAGMGVAVGDYNRDGNTDLFVTNFSDDVNTLYRNRGDGTFVDATFEASLGGLVRPYLGWSTTLFDADHDGWLDIFVANGHIYPQLSDHPSGLRYAQQNLLFRNEGGRFALQPPGPGLGGVHTSRGAAYGDYDNDGDTDLLVLNLNESPSFLRNDSSPDNQWLGLELVGSTSNRDGIGARVELTVDGSLRVQEARRAYGFQSAHDPRVTFGLGATPRVERVEIRWPSGHVQALQEPPLGRYLVVHEGLQGPSREYAAQRSASPGPAEPAVPGASSSVSPLVSPLVSSGAAEESGSAAENYQRGIEYYRSGRYEEALLALQSATSQRPQHVDSRYALGLVLYAGLGRFQEAADELEQVVQQDTLRADVRELLGAVYLGLNLPQRAIDALSEAARLQPKDWGIHHRLGLAYTRKGLIQEAAESFRHATRLAPYVPQAHLDLARLYERQNDSEAADRERALYERWAPVEDRVSRFKQEVSQYPDSLEARYLLGQAYVEQGRLKEAFDRFREAIERDSTYAEPYYGVGAVMHMGGDLQRAVMAYEKAVSLQPDLFLAHADLGQAYYQLGHYEPAAAAYQKALVLRPDLPITQSKLGLAYAQTGRVDEAIQAYGEALRQDSSLVDTRNALAHAYAAQARFDLAIEQWRAILRQDAAYPKVAELLDRAESAQARARQSIE